MAKSKKPDTSQQDALLAQQRQEAEEARLAAEAEAAALRDQRISKQKAARGRLTGRRSLIATSELGVKENLG